jgi:hypothetical protein
MIDVCKLKFEMYVLLSPIRSTSRVTYFSKVGIIPNNFCAEGYVPEVNFGNPRNTKKQEAPLCQTITQRHNMIDKCQHVK